MHIITMHRAAAVPGANELLFDISSAIRNIDQRTPFIYQQAPTEL